MKILYYCQHVLGMGHYFRSLEICRALAGHDVLLVTGGDPVDLPLPVHVQPVLLPALMMDERFDRMVTSAEKWSPEEIQTVRCTRLMETWHENRPEFVIIELYPFGRKAFRFELDPLLDRIRSTDTPDCRVVCSVRDILVEKQNVSAYENRVVEALNRWFDAVLIHSDPAIVRLEETFSRVMDIHTEIVYTGFVTPRPKPGDRAKIRNGIGLTETDRLIVVSAGGGKVGKGLLQGAIQAFSIHLTDTPSLHMQVFTGPFLEEADFRMLREQATPSLRIDRFTPDFPAWLSAADLSISMAGYNTCMNILAAGTPALVHPFGQNREQGLRAHKLEDLGHLTVIPEDDMEPRRLARLIRSNLGRDANQPASPVLLDGALVTAEWIQRKAAA